MRATVELLDGEVRIEDAKLLTFDLNGITYPSLWNGWAMPIFTAGQVDEIIEQTEASSIAREHGELEALDLVERQGAVVIIYDSYFDDDGEDLSILAPDDDGFYWLGTANWTWEFSDDSVIDGFVAKYREARAS